jgi:hypothetical protein
LGQNGRRIPSTVKGVQLGAQIYSFRNLPLDGMIRAMVEMGLGDCEVFSPHVEPRVSREELRKWRLTVPLDDIKAARKQFDDAGINVSAYNLSFNDSFTDEEIDRGFQLSKAFRVNLITASSTLLTAPLLAPFAEKYRMTMAWPYGCEGFEPICHA